MDDLATLTGQPTPITVAGTTYQVYPLTIHDLSVLQAWCDQQLPDPFEAVQRQIGTGRFTAAQEKYLLQCAVEVSAKAKPRIGSPEAQALLFQSLDGISQLLWVAIRKGDPAFTIERANELAPKIGPTRLQQLIEVTEYSQVQDDPKAHQNGSPPAG